MMQDCGRTALYRLYDSSGALLYIGVTNDPQTRFAQHAADKNWWPLVARTEIEWYSTRPDALAAEEAAIKAKSPRFNRDHSPAWPRIPVMVEISENMARALDIFCHALRSPTVNGTEPDRETVLWCLLERELKARGLNGDPACYHSSIAWPDGVSADRAGERCTCGRIITPSCSPWTDTSIPV